MRFQSILCSIVAIPEGWYTHAQKLPAKIRLKPRYRKVVYFKSVSRTGYSFEGRQTIYRWTRLRLNFGLVVVGKSFEHFGSRGRLFQGKNYP